MQRDLVDNAPSGRRRRRRTCRRWAGAALLAGFVVLLAGCPEPFDPYWRVDSYRILGLKSDPITLKPGDVATLSVLDYSPEGKEVTYRWSWCPVEPSAQQRYECPLRRLGSRTSDAGLEDAAGAPDAGGGGMGRPALDPELFDLGSGETAGIPYPGSREQVVEFCEQLQEAIAGADQASGLGGRLPTEDCSRSFEIAVRLEASVDGKTAEVAKKDIQLWTGGEHPNTNPKHGGISIRVAKPTDVPKARESLDWVPPPDRDRSEQWYETPEGEAVPVLANMPYDVRAEVGEESVETYRAPPPVGSDRERGEERQERLTFRWFVSGATVAKAKRIHIPGRNDLEELRESTVNVDGLPDGECQPAGEDGASGDLSARDPCDVFVGSVVRDGRDGQNWSERRLRVIGSAVSEN